MNGKRVRGLIEAVIHALFWAGVYYALKALTMYSFKILVGKSSGSLLGIDGRTSFPHLWVVLTALMLLFYGNVLFLFPRVIRLKSRGPGVAIVAGWAMLLFGGNYIVIRLLIGHAGYPPGLPKPVHYLPDGTPFPAPPVLSAGDWTGMQLAMAAVFLSILGITVAYFFIKEWIRNDLRRSHAEAQQLSTEIRFLRSQINPHFLFNTLNNLFSMAQRKGNDDLADGISTLSGMMRYMIYESNTETVSLQREIAYLKDCIALHKLRYADSEVAVVFRHPAPALAAGVAVAPMLFVPFLENAFKHGVSIGRHSRIDVGIMVEGNKLVFTCENTDHGVVKRLSDEEGGIGLDNVRRRLELVYPGRYTLTAAPREREYSVNLQIDLA
ncbi:MAG TPA: sensor histidine kinase [Dinghuibacter sp.]|uniref:sensor histidine kinase n=1 Tax=Dinghuibacter sp. TaxID=2024697 RepID=UPI002B5AE069|nr:sensor histidine kinase [Dinghuibacter sp.]HTJ12628.1 sensor histidine kinase [Dinghuibacter sp.]